MRDEPSVTFGTVKAILDGVETNINVVEYERGVFKEYWIKLGDLINAIYRPNNHSMSIGVGAKKFAKEIKDIVYRYQLARENLEYAESNTESDNVELH